MVDGRWELAVDTPMGRRFLQADLRASGSEVFGTISGELNNDVQITDGKIDGKDVSFSAFLNTPAGATNISAKLRVSDDAMTGTVSTSFGTFNMTGTKK